MGMGRYQQTKQPQISRPEDFGESMANLLVAQSKQYDKIGNAVEGYGQSRARNRVAGLLGSDEYKNAATPGAKEALLMAATGGRNLGEEGVKMLNRSGNNATNNWKNEEDIKASSVLFGRQQQRDATSHANSMARQAQGYKNSVNLASMNNKARQKLYGDTPDSKVETLVKSDGRKKYLEEIAKTTDPKLRNQLVQEGYLNDLFSKNDRIALEKLGIINLAGGMNGLNSPATSRKNTMKIGEDAGDIKYSHTKNGHKFYKVFDRKNNKWLKNPRSEEQAFDLTSAYSRGR